MDNNLEERVMIERVELIARLSATGVCGDRDREVALGLIAELACGVVLSNSHFSVNFSSVT
ncbi:hypothetical protein [Pantoea agglomerans]|uniref:Uncharacterized protein n=1 Tax=Enterobacter agglomerans TaxID=549 RepID=A0ACC5RK59_ENTAG|nr:hypothetical protein [Pantoea agglomerans]MBK4725044.1 hypothetical protein [Pantoea agglomerans]